MKEFDEDRNRFEVGKIPTKIFYPKKYPSTTTYDESFKNTYIDDYTIFLLPDLPYHKLFLFQNDTSPTPLFGTVDFLQNNTVLLSLPWNGSNADTIVVPGRWGLPNQNAFGNDTMRYEGGTILVASTKIYVSADELRIKLIDIASGSFVRLAPLVISSMVPW